MIGFLRYMMLLPSLNFSIAAAEIFPWAALYASIMKGTYRLHLAQILFLVLIVFSGAYGVLIYDGSTDFFRSFFAYLNPILIFFAIYRASNFEINNILRVVKFMFFVLVGIGFLQYSGLLRGLGLESLMNFLVPRGAVSVLGGGRGVTLLSTEPARAGIEFLFIYAVYRTSLRPRCLVVYDAFVFGFLLFVIKASTSVLFGLIFLMWFYPKFMVLGGLVFGFYIGLNVLELDNRAFQLLLGALTQSSVADLFNLVVSESGFRLVSIISAYYEGVTSVVGHGVGTWRESSVVAMVNAGYPPESIRYFVETPTDSFGVRPTSFLANVALDMGLIGIFLFVALMLPPISRYRFLEKGSRAVVILFLLSTIFMGSVGNPIPWISLAVVLRSRRVENYGDTQVRYQSG